MINTEEMMRSACISRDAADRASQAATTIDEAVRRFAVLLEDGYGGNGLRLIEALENVKTVVVPDGWQLVPIEPTKAMLEKCFKQRLLDESIHCKGSPADRKAYQVMLTAAPKLEEGS